MNDEHWSAVYDSARAVRVHALRSFGLTDRQARFLVTVMAHSGSFLEGQYCAFAGIVQRLMILDGVLWGIGPTNRPIVCGLRCWSSGSPMAS